MFSLKKVAKNIVLRRFIIKYSQNTTPPSSLLEDRPPSAIVIICWVQDLGLITNTAQSRKKASVCCSWLAALICMEERQLYWDLSLILQETIPKRLFC